MTSYLAVLKNYAGFRGRARRREYWMFVLVNAIIGVALVVIGKLTKMPDGPTFGVGMSRNGLGVYGIGVFSNPVLFQVVLDVDEYAVLVRGQGHFVHTYKCTYVSMFLQEEIREDLDPP